MTSPGRWVHPLAVLAVLAATLLQACGDDASSRAAPSPDDPSSVLEETPSATPDPSCEPAVPAEAVTVLGWSPDGGAVSTAQGCERRSAEGYLKVRDISVVGEGADGEEAAQEEFDVRCASFDSNPDPEDTAEEPTAATPVDWLGDDTTACAVEPTGDIGLTKVLLLTPAGELTELWVAALVPTDQARVREAVTVLAEAAVA